MTGEVLVKVEGVSKKFCKDLKTSLWYGVKDLLTGVNSQGSERKLRSKEFWALKNISFELRRGECLGVIGHNGAGKSTLLKILNGLINPDSGSVLIRGRVGALIELGAGFNPILTGRENIYNNGALLGFTKKEIDQKIDTIIDFSEIREFIDMPVQNYSSGMKVRLGFSIAVQMQPDVLIIDEVLAVGDANFIIKSYNRIHELIKSCAVIFVSHNMPQVAKLTDRLLYMQKGEVIVNSTNINRTISDYLSKQSNFEIFSVSGGENIHDFRIKKNEKIIMNSNLEIKFMSDLDFQLDVRFRRISSPYFGVVVKFFDLELRPCGVFVSEKRILNKLTNQLGISIKNINLSPSSYSVTIWVICYYGIQDTKEIVEMGIDSAFRLDVVGDTISNFAFSRYNGDLVLLN